MQLPRRGLVGAGLATSAAIMAGMSSARAQNATAPAGGPPGWYRIPVGEIDVTLVNEGYAQRPLDASFVRNAELADVQGALAAAFQPTETITIPFTTTVVRTGDQLVLIDAGFGEMAPPTGGRWMSNFKAAGYAPEDVTLIVASHFHGDHVQGIRAKDGSPIFPNATIMVPEAEWAFWMDEGQMSRAPEGMKPSFQAVRRVFEPVADEVEQYSGEREIVPGITALPAPGHTPGHTTFLVASGNEQLLIWSDTTNKPELFVRNPGWQAVFDMNGDEAAATRRRMLDMAATDKLRVAGYHFPFPANGFIAVEADSYRFVPAFWHL